MIVDAQEGMEVVGAAADGLEAVRLVDELAPDVVLMDIRMPEMDGVEATRQIFLPDRAARRETPVRVVVLTTFNLDDRAATAIRYGASGFLLKDTTPLMLRDAIRTVHAGNAVLAPADLSTLLEGQFRGQTPTPPAYLTLTDKEREVFAAVAKGLSNTEIAGLVFASESTVKTHVGAILRKLGLRDRVQIVVFAHEHGLPASRPASPAGARAGGRGSRGHPAVHRAGLDHRAARRLEEAEPLAERLGRGLSPAFVAGADALDERSASQTWSRSRPRVQRAAAGRGRRARRRRGSRWPGSRAPRRR